MGIFHNTGGRPPPTNPSKQKGKPMTFNVGNTDRCNRGVGGAALIGAALAAAWLMPGAAEAALKDDANCRKPAVTSKAAYGGVKIVFDLASRPGYRTMVRNKKTLGWYDTNDWVLLPGATGEGLPDHPRFHHQCPPGDCAVEGV
jgi:hypothetical protein